MNHSTPAVDKSLRHEKGTSHIVISIYVTSAIFAVRIMEVSVYNLLKLTGVIVMPMQFDVIQMDIGIPPTEKNGKENSMNYGYSHDLD